MCKVCALQDPTLLLELLMSTMGDDFLKGLQVDRSQHCSDTYACLQIEPPLSFVYLRIKLKLIT